MAADLDLNFPQRSEEQIQQPNPTTERTQRAAGPNFFRDGENVHFMRAESVSQHSFDAADNTLRLEVQSKEYINRTAQTHDSVMHQFVDGTGTGSLHFEISFFTPDIFRIKFSAEKDILQALTDEPAFPPPEARMLVGKRHDVSVSFSSNGESLSLSSRSVRISVQRAPFRIQAYRSSSSSTPFFSQRLSDLFITDVIPTSTAHHAGRTAVFDALAIHPNEALFGLGERFDAVARLGRPVDFVNHDAIGTSNTRSYINAPFLWSTAGYGLFLNSCARTDWDVGMSEQGTLGFGTEEAAMDYFVIAGESPAEILGRYARDLTGRAEVPAPWTFGLWLSRNSYQSWGVVDEVLRRAGKERVPVDVMHLDTAWFREDWNMDLVFDGVRFKGHEEKMRQLKGDGVRVSLWQCTFVAPRRDNELFVEGREKNYFGREKVSGGGAGSELYKYPEGSSGWRLDDAVIDYSNPDCREWYGGKIAGLIRQGASAIKTDFGDCISPDAWYKNVEGRRFQNLYSLVYNATIWKAIKSVDSDAAIWARSGTAGSQRYPMHWGGDSQCSWSALQGSFKATLSMGLSGFPFFSHDIGGFIGKPEPELYVRWAQLGLLGASHSRTHGAGDENAREPWAFGEEALRVFRKFADLKYRLLPYIIQQSREGAAVALPLIRHLILQWPKDRNVWGIETQYMLGESIMVAPVLMPAADIGKTMSVYFPQGKWYDFWTQEEVIDSRGEWREVDVPALDGMAMWVKAGAIICWAEEGRQRTWNKAGRIVEIRVYGVPRDAGRVWSCGNGDGGIVTIKEHQDGWVCEEDQDVRISSAI